MRDPLPGRFPDNPAVDPHVPVLIDAIVRECAPVRGVWLDGTLGAGGYARALLAAGRTG
jgi:16S rRNA (cytosine1402-N4)-methyltransferase